MVWLSIRLGVERGRPELLNGKQSCCFEYILVCEPSQNRRLILETGCRAFCWNSCARRLLTSANHRCRGGVCFYRLKSYHSSTEQS